MSPLLTETPVECFIKSNMSRGDHLSCSRVPNKVTIGVIGISDENAFECSIGHLATVIGWYVDVCWATKGSKMLKVWDMSCGQCDLYTFNAGVV